MSDQAAITKASSAEDENQNKSTPVSLKSVKFAAKA